MTKSRFDQKNDQKGQDNYVQEIIIILSNYAHLIGYRGPSRLETIAGFLDFAEAPST